MGQDQAEEGNLLALPPQLHHRLAEVDLGMARRVMQRHEGRRRTQGQGRVLCPAGVAARRLRAADAAQRASAEGRRKLRLENLRGTAKALLDGGALETIPIMEYVWERTNRVLANEELLPRRERADGRHVGEERNGACGVLGTSRQGGRMANDIDRWRQVPPGYESRPVAMR